MKRLTKDDVAAKLKDVIDKFDADGLRKNVDPSDRRYVKLAEYEQTGLTPEQIRQVVRCKDCAFVDSLECPINYIDRQRMIFTNRAPDWFCAEGRRKDEQPEA